MDEGSASPGQFTPSEKSLRAIQLQRTILNISKSSFADALEVCSSYISVSGDRAKFDCVHEAICASSLRPHSHELLVSLLTELWKANLLPSDLASTISQEPPHYFLSNVAVLRLIRDLYLSKVQISLKDCQPPSFWKSFFLIPYIPPESTEEFKAQLTPATLKEMNVTIEKLSADGWKLLKEITTIGYLPGFGTALFEDDADSLIRIVGHNGFDYNQRIHTLSYMPWADFFVGYEPALLDVCAFFGSIRCFNLILLNGGRPGGSEGFGMSIAGGNTEIIKAVMDAGSGITDCAKFATKFIRQNVLHWIIEELLGNLPTSELIDEVAIPALESNNLEVILLCMANGSLKKLEKNSGETSQYLKESGHNLAAEMVCEMLDHTSFEGIVVEQIPRLEKLKCLLL